MNYTNYENWYKYMSNGDKTQEVSDYNNVPLNLLKASPERA